MTNENAEHSPVNKPADGKSFIAFEPIAKLEYQRVNVDRETFLIWE